MIWRMLCEKRSLEQERLCNTLVWREEGISCLIPVGRVCESPGEAVTLAIR